MYQATDVVSGIDEIRDEFSFVHVSQTHKKLDHIDALCRTWIERSPFLCMATFDRDGNVDVSPKGDPAGFVKVVDAKTLAIPDRPGNHLFDSFANIFETGRLGLVFLVPGRNEVVRVNGRAQIVRDPDLLAGMVVNRRAPAVAILARVEEAYFHCGKSIIRSRLWQSDAWPSVEGLPSYGEALVAHGSLDMSLAEADAGTRSNDEQRLYDE